MVKNNKNIFQREQDKLCIYNSQEKNKEKLTMLVMVYYIELS